MPSVTKNVLFYVGKTNKETIDNLYDIFFPESIQSTKAEWVKTKKNIVRDVKVKNISWPTANGARYFPCDIYYNSKTGDKLSSCCKKDSERILQIIDKLGEEEVFSIYVLDFA